MSFLSFRFSPPFTPAFLSLSCLVLLTLIALPAQGQSTERGQIEGRIVTADGAAVTDAEIDLVDLRLHAHVDDDGSFRFTNLPPGRYLLRIESLAGGELTRRVEVAAGETTDLDLTLAIIRHDDEVVVTGTAIARSQLELAQPTTVLSGEELRFRQQATLGETLAQQAGVSSSTFGQGASRPVIRGIGGDRVRMLQDGVGVGDASSTSPDHAVSIEPAQASRIEVLHGPATLLYGSSAIGGVVNVLDERIPDRRPETKLGGFVDLAGGSVADERTAAASLGGGSGDWAWHVDGTLREAEAYDIPGFAELEGAHEDEHGEDEEHEEEPAFGTVPNTDLESRSGSFGVSRFFGDSGYIGVSVSSFDTEYGVPGEHGEHEEEHEEGEEEHEEGEEEHGEEGVRIDLERLRYDVRAEVRRDLGPFQGARLRLGIVDYEHAELEGEEREIGTEFFNDFVEGRIELVQKPRGRHTGRKAADGAAKTGSHQGSVGVQFGRKALESIGAEAYLPKNETTQWALFTFQEFERPGGKLRYQVGGRWESQETTNEVGLPDRSFDGLSASAGLVWIPVEGYSLALSAARSTKLPNSEELYSNGAHFATRAFELGNIDLDEETSTGLDLTLRKTSGRLTAELTFFHNDFDDFIFQAFTGDEEDGLPVLLYSQADARFRGLELEARLGLWEDNSQHLDLSFTGDLVRAEFDAGGYLPRIPPRRLGVGLHYHRPRWHGYLEVWDVDSQDRVAANETPTEGYNLVNAGLSYRRIVGEQFVDIVLTGRNLTDEEARNHVSFLKDIAPQPGRDVNLALRWTF